MNRCIWGCAMAAVVLMGPAAGAVEIDMTDLPQGISFRPRTRIESYLKDDNFGINEYQRIVGAPHPDPPPNPFSFVQEDVQKKLAAFLVQSIGAHGFVGDTSYAFGDAASVKMKTVTLDQFGWSPGHRLAVLRCSSPGTLKTGENRETYEGDINFVGFVRTDDAGSPVEVLLALGSMDVGQRVDFLHSIMTIKFATTFEGDDAYKIVLEREGYAGMLNLIVTLRGDDLNVEDIHVDAWD